MQFMPNSPSPPSGITCNFPDGMGTDDASTGRRTRFISYPDRGRNVYQALVL
jgi:hypothetical protein